MYIEELKRDRHFDTYYDTVLWFVENESDQEVEQVVRVLNKKIVEEMKKEFIQTGVVRGKDYESASLDL